MCCNHQIELTNAETLEVIGQCRKAKLEVCLCGGKKCVNVYYSTMKINGCCTFYLEGHFCPDVLAAIEAASSLSFEIKNRDCCGNLNTVTVTGTPTVFDACGEDKKLIRVFAKDISGVKTCQ